MSLTIHETELSKETIDVIEYIKTKKRKLYIDYALHKINERDYTDSMYEYSMMLEKLTKYTGCPNCGCDNCDG
jgi:hypothetical protein